MFPDLIARKATLRTPGSRCWRTLRASVAATATLLAVSAASAAQLVLTWTDNASNETGFRIERAASGGSYTEIATTSANVATYTDTNLPSGTTYTYRVRAFNDAGNSDYCTPVSATTSAPANTAPTISDIANIGINANSSTGALAFTIGDAETTAASLTVSGSSSNPTLVPNANITFGGSGANRTVVVTPATGQSGFATITITVSDGSINVTDTFIVTVTTANTAPTISDIANRSTSANTSTSAVPFTIGDSETAASNLVLSGSSSNNSLVSSANIVFGGSGANRTVTVNPSPNQTGSATITVTVSDGSLTASDSFVLTVNAANTAPTISDLANLTMDANSTSGPIAFTVGDAQTSAGALILSSFSSNPALLPTAQIIFGGSGANRTVLLAPSANQTGSATVTLTVSDGQLASSDSFVLTVNAVNTAPTISALSNRTIDANSDTGAISFSITDAETSAASLTLIATSSNPTLIPSGNLIFGGAGANRTLTATPLVNQSGTATLTVTVSDGQLSATSSFTLTVNALNTAPTLSSVASRSIDANTSTGPIAFTIGDAETAASALTVTATSSNTTLVPNSGVVLGGSGTSRTIALTPASNQTGASTITLTVSDGTLSTVRTFVITVTPIVTAPTISDIANRTIDANGSTGSIAFIIGHANVPATSLVVTAASSNPTLVPESGLVLGGTDANRTLVVTPASGQSGSAIITVAVTDGTLTTSDSFVLNVNALNSAPTISHLGNRTLPANVSTGALAVTIGDAQTPAGSLTLTASTSNPGLLPSANILFGGSGANRTVTLTPVTGQSGNVTVTLTVSDGTLTASDSFDLTVTANNTPPTISDILNRTIEVNTSTGALPFTVGDVESPAVGLIVTATSSNLTVLPLDGITLGGVGPNRTVNITPSANRAGSSTITLTVDDGSKTASTSFVVTVTSANHPPTISDIGNRTLNANASTGPIAFVVADDETSAGSLIVTASASNPTLLPANSIQLGGSGSNRTITLTPAANQGGTATVTLIVSDGNTSTGTSFVLTVQAPSTAPTITPMVNRTISANTSTGALPFTVNDSQVPANNLTVTVSSSNPTLLPASALILGGSGASRTITVTPAANQFGSATITLTVNNGSLSANTTFDVTVNAPNTAPSITTIPGRSIEAGSAAPVFAFTVGDSQTAAASLTVTATSSNSTLLPVSAIRFAGVDADRTATLTPVTGQTGSATVTLTVSDGSLTATTSFTLTVTAKNTAPTITSVTNRSMDANRSLAPIAFTIGDAQTAAGSLTVTATSSNTTLLPATGLVLEGNGAARTVTLTPAAGQTGTSTVTLTVSDGALSASTTFLLTVNVPNSLPTISTIGNRSTVVNRNSGEIEFTVGDAETPVGNLVVTGGSSNLSVLPAGNIVFGGSGATRTVTLTPAAGQMGQSTVTIMVSDGSLYATTTFTLTVTASSTAPRISDLANRTIVVNSNSAQSFTVSDAETAAGSLTVTAASQNTFLVPVSNIILGGSGGNRTVLITPVAERTGLAVITLTVSDGILTSTSSFSLQVTPYGNAPVIGSIANRTIDANTSTGAISFVLTDPDTQLANVSLTATSSNTSLVAASGIALGGSGSTRTITVTPIANRTGNTLITLTANDGANTSTFSFMLTVNAVNLPPTIDAIANRIIEAANGAEVIGFTIGDADTALNNLTLTATSSNTALLGSGSLTFAGTGPNRTLTVSPAADRSGTTSITVTVSDGNLSASTTFSLTIQAPATQPGGGVDQPSQIPTSITQQPQSASVASHGSTTLQVVAVGAVPLTYQWYQGARGDTSTPIAGATSAAFTTPALTATTSYWVRVTSPVDSVSSQAAIITVQAEDRMFFGAMGSGSSITSTTAGSADGAFALLVRADGTGVLLADSTALPAGLAVTSFTINANGFFSFVAPGIGQVSGQITGISVSGTVGTSGLSFAGLQESTNGPTNAVAGLYDGAVAFTSDGSILALAGTSGQAFVSITERGVARGGMTSLSTAGLASVTLGDGRTIHLNINGQTGTLGGTVEANGRTLDIGGQRDDVTAAVRVSNLSIRADVGGDAGSLTTGFSIAGSGTKRVLIRAAGPSLATFGVTNALANPRITVFKGNAMIAQNDDWTPEMAETFASMGAFSFAAGSKDSAIVLDLPAGGYTASVESADGSAGNAVIEVYDADSLSTSSPTRLSNISLLGQAGQGGNVIITGFNVTGTSPKRLLIRAVGQELAGYGVPNTLQNPQLGVYASKDGQVTEVATNDDWDTDAEVITQLSSQVGAFALSPGSKSAALVLWLAPGTYTAHTRSGDTSAGAVIVEVYELP